MGRWGNIKTEKMKGCKKERVKRYEEIRKG